MCCKNIFCAETRAQKISVRHANYRRKITRRSFPLTSNWPAANTGSERFSEFPGQPFFWEQPPTFGHDRSSKKVHRSSSELQTVPEASEDRAFCSEHAAISRALAAGRPRFMLLGRKSKRVAPNVILLLAPFRRFARIQGFGGVAPAVAEAAAWREPRLKNDAILSSNSFSAAGALTASTP